MRSTLVALLAIGSVTGAQVVRDVAREEVATRQADVPYAPSPGAAPFVALGYREVVADLLYVRLLGYLGGADTEAHGLAALAEAVAALDPQLRRIYQVGALAMSLGSRGVDQAIHHRAIALLEAGARAFPDDWRFPRLAGLIYLVDLVTDDAAERAEWDRRGAQLLEAAARKPNAPAEAGLTAAYMQSKLGQHERAVENLRELLLLTTDDSARAKILAKLAEISEANQDEIAAELLEARKRFERQWHAERPAVPASFYVLLGPPAAPGFDLGDLAVGGRALPAETFERLEPLVDDGE